MKTAPRRASLILMIVTAALLILMAVALMIPTSREAVFQAMGLGEKKPVYNGFEPFVPLVPGYFPDEFSITHVHHEAQTSGKVQIYAETYASDQGFFLTIQRQGPGVEPFAPQDGVSFQGQPGSLTIPVSSGFQDFTDLKLPDFETRELWMAKVNLREIQVEVITNLPKEEAIRFTEGLVPAICTQKPTQETGP